MMDADIAYDLLFDMTVPRSPEEEDLLLQRMNRFSWEVASFQITSTCFFVLNPPGKDQLKVLAVDNSKNRAIVSGHEISRDFFFRVYREFVDYLAAGNFYPSPKMN